jgi:hypothetical protein
MTNDEIEKEIISLNTNQFKKTKSRISVLQSELRARKMLGVNK